MGSSAVFASASEASVVTSGVMVGAEIKRVVEPAPGFMKVAALEAADSCSVDSTEGVTEAPRDVGTVVVEGAPIAELVVDVTWTVLAAPEDRVSGVLVATLDPLVTVVGPSVVVFSMPVGLFGGFGL